MNSYEKMIKLQKELCESLQEQIDAAAELEAAHKEQIQCLKERVCFLERQNKTLIHHNNQLSQKSGELESICTKQQELLESFSQIFSKK